MNYEWAFIIDGLHTLWYKAKAEKSAFKKAMKVAMKRYPEATNKGYARSWIDDDGVTKIDFGHYTVFIKIRKVNENER